MTRMSWKKWSRFSPRVALLLAVATAVPLAALLWVGWRALEQDRALENEQIRQQVERAADIVAAALQRAVAASERRLAQGSKDWPDGAAAMTVSGETVQVWPMGRAAYLPVAPQLTELSGAPFAAGEAVEFRQRDLNGAAAIYRSCSPQEGMQSISMPKLCSPTSRPLNIRGRRSAVSSIAPAAFAPSRSDR